MNHIGKLNHGNYQSISLGALNNNINTEISGSVEAANNIIGDMATQRKDMLIGLENLQSNLIGTKDEKTGERIFDGLIGRAYKNDAIQTAQDTQKQLLGQAYEEYDKKIKALEQDNNDIRNIIGAKNDAIDTYKNDKSMTILGNSFNAEKEAVSQFLMAHTGLDLQTSSASWNNGGQNSQVYQQLKAAGFNDNQINQIMSRANTINNLDKEGQNLANGIVPKEIQSRFGQEMNGNLLGKGYTQEQAARLTLIGTQNGVNNLYQASSDMEEAANKLRLQPNFKDREAILLENQLAEQKRHNARIEQQNNRYLLGNQQQNQPIDDTQTTDEPIQQNEKIEIVEKNRNGQIVAHTRTRSFIIHDESQLTALDENGNPMKLEPGKYYAQGTFNLDGQASTTQLNTGDKNNFSPAMIQNRASYAYKVFDEDAPREVKAAALEELAKVMPFEIYAKDKNGKYITNKYGEKILDMKAISKYTNNTVDGGFLDNFIANSVNEGKSGDIKQQLYYLSRMGEIVDNGNMFVDYKIDTMKQARSNERKTWNQQNNNTMLNKTINQTNTNQKPKFKPNSLVDNPQGKDAFEIQQAARNGDKEAEQILVSNNTAKTITSSMNKDVAKYVNDDQKMIKDTEIDAEHLNQDSKYQAISALAIMSVASPQLRTDKKLADKTLKALYEMLELERLGKSDGNWSEVFADFKDSLNVKQLSNIGINVNSVEDLGKYFTRKDIRDIMKGSNIHKNMLSLLMYHK